MDPRRLSMGFAHSRDGDGDRGVDRVDGEVSGFRKDATNERDVGNELEMSCSTRRLPCGLFVSSFCVVPLGEEEEEEDDDEEKEEEEEEQQQQAMAEKLEANRGVKKKKLPRRQRQPSDMTTAFRRSACSRKLRTHSPSARHFFGGSGSSSFDSPDRCRGLSAEAAAHCAGS
eukprot:scaffold846_cov252-Pinguiococcus_pyrenoidosus.AAC.39